MCKLFIDANADNWKSSSHSLRIEGVVTSVRLENYFWRTLEDIADRDGLNVPQMINRLYRESVEADHDLGNFTSFLRVCCMRYLALQVDGSIPSEPSISLSSLDTTTILKNERLSQHQRGRASVLIKPV